MSPHVSKTGIEPAFIGVFTQRLVVTCVVLSLVTFAAASPGGLADAKRHSIGPLTAVVDEGPRSIHQETDFKASPQRIYEALLDSKQFTEFSGAPAKISREAGGAFSLFDGYITGRNVELVPNQRIIQAWRAGSWSEGVYSIVRFELKAQGSGTHLIMDHEGFPEGAKESLNSGWKEHYWDPLRKYLG